MCSLLKFFQTFKIHLLNGIQKNVDFVYENVTLKKNVNIIHHPISIYDITNIKLIVIVFKC